MAADLWSATSYKRLREEALEVERHNRLHPEAERRTPMVTERLAGTDGPVVAVSDNMCAVPDQVARWVGRPYTSLGTDGFGRSDTREALRSFFEVDAGQLARIDLTVGEGALAQAGGQPGARARPPSHPLT